MTEPQVQMAILALVALGSLFFFANRLSRASAISNTPTSRIRSAAQGYCELIGQAFPDQPKLRAPLSGLECLWFEMHIEKRVQSGKHSHWQTVRQQRSSYSFFLDDATGRCHVHPDGAHIDPLHRDRWSHPPVPQTGLNTGLFGGRYRYSEKRIHEGDTLYALGNFQTVYPLSIEAQSEQHQVELLREWKKDYDNLLQRFDLNADGQLDEAEWETARSEAARQAKLYTLESADREPAHMLVKPPARGQHYILSFRDPERLVLRYRLQAGFLALLAVSCLGAIGYLLAGGRLPV